MSDALRILFVSAEYTPFAKTGGLGDAVASLARALTARGADVRVLLPCYGWIDTSGAIKLPRPFPVAMSAFDTWCALHDMRFPGGVHGYLLEHNTLYDRERIYGPRDDAYADNCLRFSLLCRAATSLCAHFDWWPHVIHAHDWPAAMTAGYLRLQVPGSPLQPIASVLTIHNLAHQGWFNRVEAEQTGLPLSILEHLGLTWGDGFSLMRAALLHSTLITTVSPTYAKEIQTPAFGCGVDDLLRARENDILGILNGIDGDVWDPSTDRLLPARYSPTNLAGKRACKRALQKEARLPQSKRPLLGLVSRLDPQKGIDLVADAIPLLLESDCQIVLLGTGQSWAEQRFEDLARLHPDRVCSWIAFDERKAHLIEAGSDFFLMPSRWEPCGLNQMYSQRYGTLPIVRPTGGLKDTVIDPIEDPQRANGFSFAGDRVEELVEAVQRGLGCLRTPRAARQDAPARHADRSQLGHRSRSLRASLPSGDGPQTGPTARRTQTSSAP
jgi:starch synthase